MPANKLTVEEVIAATRSRKAAAPAAETNPLADPAPSEPLPTEYANLPQRTIDELQAGRAALARR